MPKKYWTIQRSNEDTGATVFLAGYPDNWATTPHSAMPYFDVQHAKHVAETLGPDVYIFEREV